MYSNEISISKKLTSNLLQKTLCVKEKKFTKLSTKLKNQKLKFILLTCEHIRSQQLKKSWTKENGNLTLVKKEITPGITK